jgi:hypothetical protein
VRSNGRVQGVFQTIILGPTPALRQLAEGAPLIRPTLAGRSNRRVQGVLQTVSLGPTPALRRRKALRFSALRLLSMGMSADFETAIRFGATHVRVGTAIFGARRAAVASDVAAG